MPGVNGPAMLQASALADLMIPAREIPCLDRGDGQADGDFQVRSCRHRLHPLFRQFDDGACFAKSAVFATRRKIVVGAIVQGRVIRIKDNHKGVRIGMIIQAAKDGTQRFEQPAKAMRLQIDVNGLRRLAENALGDNRQRGLIGRRFAVVGDFHGLTETPPRTPLYQTSLSGESPRMSW